MIGLMHCRNIDKQEHSPMIFHAVNRLQSSVDLVLGRRRICHSLLPETSTSQRAATAAYRPRDSSRLEKPTPPMQMVR